MPWRRNTDTTTAIYTTTTITIMSNNTPLLAAAAADEPAAPSTSVSRHINSKLSPISRASAAAFVLGALLSLLVLAVVTLAALADAGPAEPPAARCTDEQEAALLKCAEACASCGVAVTVLRLGRCARFDGEEARAALTDGDLRTRGRDHRPGSGANAITRRLRRGLRSAAVRTPHTVAPSLVSPRAARPEITARADSMITRAARTRACAMARPFTRRATATGRCCSGTSGAAATRGGS